MEETFATKGLLSLPTITSSNYRNLMWGWAQMPVWLRDKPTAWPHVAQCQPPPLLLLLPAAARCLGLLVSTAPAASQADGLGPFSSLPGWLVWPSDRERWSRRSFWDKEKGSRFVSGWEALARWPSPNFPRKPDRGLKAKTLTAFRRQTVETARAHLQDSPVLHDRLRQANQKSLTPVWIMKALCVTSGQRSMLGKWKVGRVKLRALHFPEVTQPLVKGLAF